MSEDPEAAINPPAEGRAARKRRRNRDALIEAAYTCMQEFGIDAMTMQNVSDCADLGVGTAYNYFPSKDALVVTALERHMGQLALRIRAVTEKFADPAEAFAFGTRTVIATATTDGNWRWLLQRPDVIADAIYRSFGPYAVADLELARTEGRFQFDDSAVLWRASAWAIVGISKAICDDVMDATQLDEAVANLLCMAGLGRTDAVALAGKPPPPLPATAADPVRSDRPDGLPSSPPRSAWQ